MQITENVLLIAGGRDIGYQYPVARFEHIFDNASYIFDTTFSTIISGGARGVDTIARHWAERKGYDFEEYPADWDSHGRSAGYRRNAEMVAIATHAIVVWDGKSKGSKHTLDLLAKAEKPHVMVRP